MLFAGIYLGMTDTEIKATLISHPQMVNSSETKNRIESLVKEIPVWEKELNTFERNANRWVEIEKKAVENVEQLRKEAERFKKLLFTSEFDSILKKQKEFCGEKIEQNL